MKTNILMKVGERLIRDKESVFEKENMRIQRQQMRIEKSKSKKNLQKITVYFRAISIFMMKKKTTLKKWIGKI